MGQEGQWGALPGLQLSWGSHGRGFCHKWSAKVQRIKTMVGAESIASTMSYHHHLCWIQGVDKQGAAERKKEALWCNRGRDLEPSCLMPDLCWEGKENPTQMFPHLLSNLSQRAAEVAHKEIRCQRWVHRWNHHSHYFEFLLWSIFWRFRWNRTAGEGK